MLVGLRDSEENHVSRVVKGSEIGKGPLSQASDTEVMSGTPVVPQTQWYDYAFMKQAFHLQRQHVDRGFVLSHIHLCRATENKAFLTRRNHESSKSRNQNDSWSKENLDLSLDALAKAFFFKAGIHLIRIDHLVLCINFPPSLLTSRYFYDSLSFLLPFFRDSVTIKVHSLRKITSAYLFVG